MLDLKMDTPFLSFITYPVGENHNPFPSSDQFDLSNVKQDKSIKFNVMYNL